VGTRGVQPELLAELERSSCWTADGADQAEPWLFFCVHLRHLRFQIFNPFAVEQFS